LRKKNEETIRGQRLGKKDSPPAAQGLKEIKVETVEERDPLTNLKLLEENRPGFHWHGTQSLKTLVYGADAPTDKNNR